MYSAALYCQYGRKVMGFTDPGTLTGELHEAIQSIYKKKELASFKPAIRELYKLCDINKDGFIELVKSAIQENQL